MFGIMIVHNATGHIAVSQTEFFARCETSNMHTAPRYRFISRLLRDGC